MSGGITGVEITLRTPAALADLAVLAAYDGRQVRPRRRRRTACGSATALPTWSGTHARTRGDTRRWQHDGNSRDHEGRRMALLASMASTSVRRIRASPR